MWAHEKSTAGTPCGDAEIEARGASQRLLSSSGLASDLLILIWAQVPLEKARWERGCPARNAAGWNARSAGTPPQTMLPIKSGT